MILKVRTNELLSLSSSKSRLSVNEIARFRDLVEDLNVNINALDRKDGMNALLKLSRNYQHDNLIQLVQPLIERGIDVTAIDPNGRNALHYLFRYYEHDILIEFFRVLHEGIKKLVLVYKRRNKESVPFYLTACERKSNVLVSSPTEPQSDIINAPDPIERNPLHLVFQYDNHDGMIQLAKALIDSGADVNAQTKTGWSPLHVLFRYHRRDDLMALTELLINRGVDLNAKTLRGWTPLHFLCRYHKNENLLPIIELLIAHKVNLTARTEEGYSASYLLKTVYWNPPKNIDQF